MTPGRLLKPLLASVLLAAAAFGVPPAVRAEEPLYLRIRANPAAGDRPRESVWERSDRRARIVIASVCTGCLAREPIRPSTPPPALSPSTEAAVSVTTPPSTAGDP